MPDEMRGEVLEAFVVLRPGVGRATDSRPNCRSSSRRFAAHAYPRRVHFVDELPKTPSGKTQRFLLRPKPTTPGRGR